MKRFVTGGLAGLAAAMALAAPAFAAPGTSTMRVEGSDRTLVPRTPVTTTDVPVGRDGENCSGTSAFATMHAATGGDWEGMYFDDFSSWFVETIKGETHASTEAGFWALWVNNHYADLGLCGTELQQGDDVVLAPRNDQPILDLTGVPATVAPGQVVTVKVTEHGLQDPTAFPSVVVSGPAAGATVTYGGASVTTGGEGAAQITFSAPGPAPVQATEPGHIRSATLSTCVTNGADGACGSAIPGGAAPVAVKDETAPIATIAGLANGRVFSRKRAPRTLRGTISADPSGIKSVRLSILRTVGKRCWAFDGESERFKRHRCGGSRSFRIGDRVEWSYLLPKRLPRGRYTIRVAAIDKAGNDSATQTEIRVR
jgi:hypothetical protein